MLLYHVKSSPSEVCCAALQSSVFRPSLSFNTAFTCWFSLCQAASPFRMRQPGGCRCAVKGERQLKLCCLQLPVSSFCWGSTGQHWSNQVSCCKTVVHWTASVLPLLSQSCNDLCGGRLQPGSLVFLCSWAFKLWMAFVCLLVVGSGQGRDNSWIIIVPKLYSKLKKK